MKTKIETTGDDLSTLWEHVNNLRSNAQVVKVEPKLLVKFLLDFQKLMELNKEGIEHEPVSA